MDNSVWKTPQKQTSSQKFYQSSLFCRFVGVQVCLLNDGPNTHYYTRHSEERKKRTQGMKFCHSPSLLSSSLLSLGTVQLRYRQTRPDRKERQNKEGEKVKKNRKTDTDREV